MKIAVLGGGNGSFAAAGDFALLGHEVSLWRRDATAVAAHRAAGSRILLKDINGRHDVQLALVTTERSFWMSAGLLARTVTPGSAWSVWSWIMPSITPVGFCAPAATPIMSTTNTATAIRAQRGSWNMGSTILS